MRDPKRIPKILDRLRIVWEKYPDLRLGQLIENVFPNTSYDFISAYNLEDERFIGEIEDYYSVARTYRRFGKERSKQ